MTFFTSRYALYVILSKSLEKVMEKIKPFSTYRHFINCFCDSTPPYSFHPDPASEIYYWNKFLYLQIPESVLIVTVVLETTEQKL